MYKGKEERTEGKNCKGISLLNMIARIYGGVLVDSVCIMIERLINNDQGVSKKIGDVCIRPSV